MSASRQRTQRASERSRRLDEEAARKALADELQVEREKLAEVSNERSKLKEAFNAERRRGEDHSMEIRRLEAERDDAAAISEDQRMQIKELDQQVGRAKERINSVLVTLTGDLGLSEGIIASISNLDGSSAALSAFQKELKSALSQRIQSSSAAAIEPLERERDAHVKEAERMSAEAAMLREELAQLKASDEASKQRMEELQRRLQEEEVKRADRDAMLDLKERKCRRLSKNTHKLRSLRTLRALLASAQSGPNSTP